MEMVGLWEKNHAKFLKNFSKNKAKLAPWMEKGA
jgi:hypothetical protein